MPCGREAAAREAGGAALHVVPIYAALPQEQQARVFEPPPAGARKVARPDTPLRPLPAASFHLLTPDAVLVCNAWVLCACR